MATAVPATLNPMPTPFLPPPVQRPRVPIWVAGTWPSKPPFRRAARWDGVVPVARGAGMVNSLTPDQVRDVVAYIGERRSGNEPFDVVVAGHTDIDGDTAVAQGYADAGATWWLEDVSPWAFGWQWDGPWPIDQMNDRVRAGPPRPRSDG